MDLPFGFARTSQCHDGQWAVHLPQEVVRRLTISVYVFAVVALKRGATTTTCLQLKNTIISIITRFGRITWSHSIRMGYGGDERRKRTAEKALFRKINAKINYQYSPRRRFDKKERDNHRWANWQRRVGVCWMLNDDDGDGRPSWRTTTFLFWSISRQDRELNRQRYERSRGGYEDSEEAEQNNLIRWDGKSEISFFHFLAIVVVVAIAGKIKNCRRRYTHPMSMCFRGTTHRPWTYWKRCKRWM